MEKTPHTDPEYWPTPLGIGLLAELDFKDKNESLNIETPGGGIFNLNTATIRAVSPELPDELQDMYLPDGEGSLGARVLAPESVYDYLEDELYEVLGLEVPSQDNTYGELVFINDIRRIIALMPERDEEAAGETPFETVLGKRVFLDFPYDDRSVDVVDPSTGETHKRLQEQEEEAEDGADEEPDIVVPESAYAQEHRLATVIDVGEDVEHVEIGDEVIPPEKCSAIPIDDEEWYYVNNESEIVGVL